MVEIFRTDFRIAQDAVPGGWLIEYNSDLPITALECAPDYFALLSPGNKYIALTPDLLDAELSLAFSCNYDMAGQFELLISFRYDLKTRSGEALRLYKKSQAEPLLLEYGKIADNRFSSLQKYSYAADEELFSKTMKLQLNLQKQKVGISFLGQMCLRIRLAKEDSALVVLS